MSCDRLLREAFKDEFNGIELNYKLDDALANVNPNQKFTAKQLESFLTKRGVSPKEIEAAKLFESGKQVELPASEWQNIIAGGRQKFNVQEYTGSEAPYEDVTLAKGAIEDDGISSTSPSYKVREFFAEKQEGNTNLKHSMDYRIKTLNESLGKPYESPYDSRSQLGWNRIHQADINGKPTTVLNELQSDWMQAERQGAGFFKSKTEELKQEYYKQKDAYEDFYTNPNNEGKEPPISHQALSELYDRVVRANNAPEIRDFPMRPEKFQQLMIVDALNEAIQNGTNKVVIPIEREGADLVGDKGVTKFYKSLDKQLDIVAKKLEKQGLVIKRGTEKYVTQSADIVEIPKNRDIAEFLESMIDYHERYDVGAELIATYKKYVGNQISQAELEGTFNKLDQGDILADIVGYMNKEQIPSNTLYTIEIREKPDSKVSWDVYSLTSALGLSSLVEQTEE